MIQLIWNGNLSRRPNRSFSTQLQSTVYESRHQQAQSHMPTKPRPPILLPPASRECSMCPYTATNKSYLDKHQKTQIQPSKTSRKKMKQVDGSKFRILTTYLYCGNDVKLRIHLPFALGFLTETTLGRLG